MFSQRTNWKLSPNRFTQALKAARSSREPIVDLTVSNPTLCGFAYDKNAILQAFHNPAALSYDPQSKGLRSAREEVTRYYRDDHHTAVDPESLVLTSGTSEAYAYVFRLLCNPHDEILVPKPSYPLFDFLADLQDVALVPYALEYAHGWFVDFPSVMRALTPRTRAILLVHPNNPTGSFLREEELRQFNHLCQERSLALIVDEVFLDFAFDGLPRRTLAANPDSLTFTLSGLSKIAALPQMKIAWVVTSGSQALVRPALDRLEVIADTFLSLSAATQLAFPALLAQRHSLRPQLLERIRNNRSFLQSAVARRNSAQLLDADGGWCAAVKINGERSDEDLAIGLLQKHRVIVHPGHFYDFPSEGHLVLSLIPPASAFEQGVERLFGWLERSRVP
jgi:alanine-synthesizing transaminase